MIQASNTADFVETVVKPQIFLMILKHFYLVDIELEMLLRVPYGSPFGFVTLPFNFACSYSVPDFPVIRRN